MSETDSGRKARDVDVPDDRPVIPAYVDLGDAGEIHARVRQMNQFGDLGPYLETSVSGVEPAELDEAKLADLVVDWTVDPDFDRADVEQLPLSAVAQFAKHITPDPASRGIPFSGGNWLL